MSRTQPTATLQDMQDRIRLLEDALFPFARSLKIARSAFDGPTDQGNLTAVAKQYISIDHFVDAFDALYKKERQGNG